MDAFIEKNLGNPGALLSLARRWVEMVKALGEASVAHGDLQHGNVLVANRELRLVDYDGMYVPALLGEGSHEVGHRNYQHPLRTEADFGPHLDNFSAWVVYVSLIALAVDPGLWRRFSGGDECLLFRRRDFEQPETSDVLRSLERHQDEVIRSAATLFKSLLCLGPRDVPSLDGHILQPAVPSATTPSPNKSWLEDHIELGPKARAADATGSGSRGGNLTMSTPADPSWILDLLVPPSGSSLLSFSNSAGLERLVFAISALLVAMLLSVNSPDLLPLSVLSVILLNLTLWVCRYRYDDSVRQFRNLASEVRNIESRIRATEREIEAANREKIRLGDHNAKKQARLAKELKALEAKEKKEIDACKAFLQSTLSRIATRRRALSQKQTHALQKIQNDIGSKVAALNSRISAVNQAETTELNLALQAKQKKHIAAYLSRFSLDNAPIEGIGPTFKKRLIASGLYTAADIDYYRVQRVHGIGPVRALSLADWRGSLEAQARKSMPLALSHGEVVTIHAKYESLRRAVEQQRSSEQQRQRREEDNVRARYLPLAEQLDQEEKSAYAKTQTAVSEVRARYAQQYCAIRERESELIRDTASRLREIDERIAEARRKLFSLHWEKSKAERKLRPYAGIRFPKYLKRIFLGSKAA
ncbi:MAG: hypothetical protein WHX93_18290 [bacterium]